MRVQFEDAYLREILIQAQYAKMCVEGMNRVLRRDAGTAYDFFKDVQEFVSHAAAISRILWPPRIQDEKRREVARKRASHLRSALAVTDENPLRARTLRDHLEHFDERLDQWTQETTHVAIIDLTIAERGQIAGDGVHSGDLLRVYQPERNVFTFRGAEFDIQALANAVFALADRVVQRRQHLAEQQRTELLKGLVATGSANRPGETPSD